MIKVLFGIAIGGIVFSPQPRLYEYIMENFIVIAIAIFIAFVFSSKNRKRKQKKFIENYHFPEELDKKILSSYPHLLQKDLIDVKQELKHFLKMANAYQPETVAMPSRVVDIAWHEFILHTKDYHAFCKRAFGHYCHHNPFSKSVTSQDIKISLQRAWTHSCKAENINPEKPLLLPALFAIDSSLNITDGNIFSVENSDELTENNTSNPNGSLKCVSGSFAGVGAVALVVSVVPGNAGGSGGGGDGGGCGGGCGGGG